MAAFADSLAPALSDTLGRLQAPPPPPPQGNFADGLAAFFGAAPDVSGAYNAGLEQRAKSTSMSAQTLSALAEAEKRRQDAMRTSFGNDVIMKAQADPNYVGSFADSIPFTTSANDYTSARLGDQEFGNREILGDPNAAPADAFAAGQGVQGKVLPRIEALGPGRELNMLTQQASTNPIGSAQIANYQEQPAAGGVPSPPSGYRTTPTGDLEFIPGGPHDPSRPTTTPMLGRERMFAERVRVAGESVADTLENIAQMPVGASTGVMGVGASPGKKILQATKDTLRNVASGSDVQIYTAALAGANRALAVLESAGLAPSGAAQQSFEALSWRAGDKENTRLYKLAEMRQTVDNAMQTALTNPGITPEMRAQVAEVQRRVAAAIPFSPIDVIMLERDPGASTLEDVMKRRNMATGAAPAAAPATPAGAVQWTKQTSPSTGAVRWINKATGETRSTAP